MIDETDARIIEILERDGRISMSELAARVGMSGPNVSERVRKLEHEGVIKAFTIEFSPRALGYTLEAIVRVKPSPGALHIVEQLILEQPRFTACDKVTGEDCFVTRLLLRDISELDDLLEPLQDKAVTNTAIIKATPLRSRMPPLR
ncbi:Lrp/AsnC family transcriptional regulator [Flexibacterium corallicola]|uniref:Lrp/AsnC family transcriptional regulator n=1 Tax=Flexibacterium corallicola TaxID=3037259 RepID=UPI00286F31A4|nr:Lrp/AsnC family transcriptional regulator [Pseudovibrio sp. M1P-2-3]